MIYLVRHGHAGNKRPWNGPDSQRPLSPTGRRESVGLIVRLGAEPIGRILSSPAVRCQQTVQPLAEQRRPALELDQRLAVEADLEQVTGMVFNLDGLSGTHDDGWQMTMPRRWRRPPECFVPCTVAVCGLAL